MVCPRAADGPTPRRAASRQTPGSLVHTPDDLAKFSFVGIQSSQSTVLIRVSLLFSGVRQQLLGTGHRARGELGSTETRVDRAHKSEPKSLTTKHTL